MFTLENGTISMRTEIRANEMASMLGRQRFGCIFDKEGRILYRLVLGDKEIPDRFSMVEGLLPSSYTTVLEAEWLGPGEYVLAIKK